MLIPFGHKKINGILLFLTTGMNLEDIVVHEIRQAQEDEFNIISFIKNYDLMEEGDRKMTTGVQYSKEIGI